MGITCPRINWQKRRSIRPADRSRRFEAAIDRDNELNNDRLARLAALQRVGMRDTESNYFDSVKEKKNKTQSEKTGEYHEFL